ncbi:MAG TPA: thioredoxin family protein [Candidatus Sulfotelmatobacter sp.]|nr:thioredoxin family protein [Candidatus Sulfotelmatobacter sp.]
MDINIKSEQELNDCLATNPRLAVLFYASWCPHSRRFLPIFDKHVSGKEKYFRRVVVDDLDELVDKYDINVYPTVLYFEKRKVVKRLDGIAGLGLDEKQLNGFLADCRIT